MGEIFAGRYELLDPVAEGGMGSVWLIQDRADGEVKIAKILRQSDASSLLRFVREQSVRVDHRHVVTPLSWAGMDDRVLFTMPLVRGGSLADLLKERGPLPARWVGVLLDQTLQGLEAVHAAGIVHRDVKPANLLLEPTGRRLPHLRLTDFGIAAPIDEPRMTQASMAIGTPGYMAPEQWHGAHPDPRQDLYSVAVVGLEMLTASRPPGTPDPVVAPGPDALPEPRELVGRLVTLLMRSTAQDPADRHPSAAQMRAELRELDLAAFAPEAGDEIEIRDHFGAGSPTPVPRPAPVHVPATRADAAGLAPTRAGRLPEAPTRSSATSVLPGPTRVEQEHPAVTASPRPRGSVVPGAALLSVGLVLLVAALLVALG